MTTRTLKLIADAMNSLEIPYEFIEFTSDPKSYYFVGEYTESESLTEDGLQESTFILTGTTTDGTWLDLENAKSKIKEFFNSISGYVATDQIGGVAIFYSNSFPIPTESDFKRIQINLKIKEWSV